MCLSNFLKILEDIKSIAEKFPSEIGAVINKKKKMKNGLNKNHGLTILLTICKIINGENH